MRKLLTSLGSVVLVFGVITAAVSVQASSYMAEQAIEKQLDGTSVDETILKGAYDAAMALDKAHDAAKAAYNKAVGAAIQANSAKERDKAMQAAEANYADAMVTPVQTYEKKLRTLFESNDDQLGKLDVSIQKALMEVTKEFTIKDVE